MSYEERLKVKTGQLEAQLQDAERRCKLKQLDLDAANAQLKSQQELEKEAQEKLKKAEDKVTFRNSFFEGIMVFIGLVFLLGIIGIILSPLIILGSKNSHGRGGNPITKANAAVERASDAKSEAQAQKDEAQTSLLETEEEKTNLETKLANHKEKHKKLKEEQRKHVKAAPPSPDQTAVTHLSRLRGVEYSNDNVHSPRAKRESWSGRRKSSIRPINGVHHNEFDSAFHSHGFRSTAVVRRIRLSPILSPDEDPSGTFNDGLEEAINYIATPTAPPIPVGIAIASPFVIREKQNHGQLDPLLAAHHFIARAGTNSPAKHNIAVQAHSLFGRAKSGATPKQDVVPLTNAANGLNKVAESITIQEKILVALGTPPAAIPSGMLSEIVYYLAKLGHNSATIEEFMRDQQRYRLIVRPDNVANLCVNQQTEDKSADGVVELESKEADSPGVQGNWMAVANAHFVEELHTGYCLKEAAKILRTKVADAEGLLPRYHDDNSLGHLIDSDFFGDSEGLDFSSLTQEEFKRKFTEFLDEHTIHVLRNETAVQGLEFGVQDKFNSERIYLLNPEEVVQHMLPQQRTLRTVTFDDDDHIQRRSRNIHDQFSRPGTSVSRY